MFFRGFCSAEFTASLTKKIKETAMSICKKAVSGGISALLLICAGFLGASANAAIEYKFTIATAADLNYTETEAELDAAVGIKDYAIYDFASLTFPTGLSVVLSGGGEPTTTWSALPALFDQNALPSGCYNFDGIANLGIASWWGPYAATNYVTNQLTTCNSPVGAAQTTTFNITPGASSFGIGLANFQSTSPASPEFPVTQHELFINGNDMGVLETLAGANWTPGITLNSYLRITSTGKELITSVGFENLTSADFLGFSHLALQYRTAAPTVTPVIVGTAGLNGWYTSDVELSWLVSGNPAPTESGCGNVKVRNTTGTTYTCSATNSVNSAQQSVTIEVDTVAPKVAIRMPANGATYALNKVVRASYTCGDAISGVTSCLGTVADGARINTTTPGMQTFSVVAIDNAGNTTTQSITYTVE
jgi:hypothetical protein